MVSFLFSVDESRLVDSWRVCPLFSEKPKAKSLPEQCWRAVFRFSVAINDLTLPVHQEPGETLLEFTL
jgi:hypothetical protein